MWQPKFKFDIGHYTKHTVKEIVGSEALSFSVVKAGLTVGLFYGTMSQLNENSVGFNLGIDLVQHASVLSSSSKAHM